MRNCIKRSQVRKVENHWHTSVISAVRRLRKDCHEFKVRESDTQTEKDRARVGGQQLTEIETDYWVLS